MRSCSRVGPCLRTGHARLSAWRAHGRRGWWPRTPGCTPRPPASGQAVPDGGPYRRLDVPGQLRVDCGVPRPSAGHRFERVVLRAGGQADVHGLSAAEEASVEQQIHRALGADGVAQEPRAACPGADRSGRRLRRTSRQIRRRASHSPGRGSGRLQRPSPGPRRWWGSPTTRPPGTRRTHDGGRPGPRPRSGTGRQKSRAGRCPRRTPCPSHASISAVASGVVTDGGDVARNWSSKMLRFLGQVRVPFCSPHRTRCSLGPR